MRSLAVLIACAAALAPACTIPHSQTVTGRALHETMRERRSAGQAEAAGFEHAGEKVKPIRVTVYRGSRLWLDGEPLDVDVLERDCPADPDTPSDCALARLADTELELRWW